MPTLFAQARHHSPHCRKGIESKDRLGRHRWVIERTHFFLLPETEDLARVSESGWQDGCHIVAARDHPLRAKQNLILTDLIAEKWVLTPASASVR